MNNNCTCRILFFILCMAAGAGAFAQENKMDKKIREALERRISKDKSFASGQRYLYREERWKRSWEGMPLATLYRVKGAPARSFNDGSGGQVVVYETESNYSGGTYVPGYTVTTTSGLVAGDGRVLVDYGSETRTVAPEDTRWASQYVETTTVYADKNGTITKVEKHIKSYHSR